MLRQRFNKFIWLIAHKPPWRKILIWGPWVVILLGCAFFLFENWRGQRALDKALAYAEGQGVSLNWEDYNPEPIPEEENLANSPLLTSAYRKEDFKRVRLLLHSSPAPAGLTTNITDLRKPLDLPLLTSSIDLRKWLEPSIRPASQEEAARELDRILAFRKNALDALHSEAISKTLVLRSRPTDFLLKKDESLDLMLRGLGISEACVEDSLIACAQGDIERALDRLELCSVFLQAETSELLVHYLIKLSIFRNSLDIVEEVLRSNAANSRQLARLQDQIATELSPSWPRMIQSELSFAVEVTEHIDQNRELISSINSIGAALAAALGSKPSKLEEFITKSKDFFYRRVPSGWFKVSLAKNIELSLQPLEGIDFSEMESREEYLEKLKVLEVPGDIAIRILGSGTSSVENPFHKLLTIETEIQILRIAILLELHQREHGTYPTALSELGIEPPLDFFSRKPLRYQLKADGTPHLWSIGRNRVDDGGLPSGTRYREGDIVWMITPIPGLTERDWRRKLRATAVN